MTFSEDIKRFNAKVENLTQEVFVGVVAEAKDSIVNGSPLTGSPGQPVDTGNLRDSWQTEFKDENTAVISTNVVYAPQNEDGISRPSGVEYRQKSAQGGRWSVALTRAGIQNIVDDVVNKLTGDA